MARNFNFGAIPSNYIPLILYAVITALIYFFIIKKDPQVCPVCKDCPVDAPDAPDAPATTISTFKQFSRSSTYYQSYTVPDNITKINILCIGGGGGGATNGQSGATTDNFNGDGGNASYVLTQDLKTKFINANRGLAGYASAGDGKPTPSFVNQGGAGGVKNVPDDTLGTSRGSVAGNKGNDGKTSKDKSGNDFFSGGTGGSVANISGTNTENVANSTTSNFGAAGKYYIGSDLSSTADKYYSYSKNGVKISSSGYGGGGQLGAGGGGGGAGQNDVSNSGAGGAGGRALVLVVCW